MSRRRSKIVGITFQRFAFPCCPVACERNRPTSDDLFYVCCVGLQFPPLDSTVRYIPPRGQMLLLPLVLRTIVKWTIPDKSFKPRQQLCSRLSNKKITFSLHSHSLIPSCRRTLFSAADNVILFSSRCRTWGRTTRDPSRPRSSFRLNSQH